MSPNPTEHGETPHRSITNPVAPAGADPWVVLTDQGYLYCYSRGNGIWINHSQRLDEVVQASGKEIWSPTSGTDYSHEIWAPELHFINGRWYVYFAADDGNNDNHRMYVLESLTPDPLGTYRFIGKLNLPEDRWAIDGTVLQLNDTLYCIWSGWEGTENVQQNLYIATLSDPYTAIGHRAVISQPEHSWEKVGSPRVNEGPQVLQRGGKTFVIYSASGVWTDHYCLGQLTLVGIDPMNPESWTKKPHPVFAPTSEVISPGHASFTQSPDKEEDWIVYHAAKHPGAGFSRNVRLQPFSWTGDGEPDFGLPVSPGISIPAPSE